jgi:glycosyltransferase involved in cell wall biosynthesis
LRILTITNVYPPHVLGGYEIACRNVVDGLRAREHNVEVLAGHAPLASYGDPPHVHRVLALRAFEPTSPATKEVADAFTYECSASQYANTATVLHHLRRFRPDIVYVWYIFGVGGLAILDLLEQTRSPWVMHLMDRVPALLLDGIHPAAAALFARNNWRIFTGAHVIAMSQQLIDEVAELTGIRFDIQPEIIPGWVEADKLRQRTRYSEPGRLRFLAAGTVGSHKGTDIIVEACGELVAQGYADFTIDIFCLSGSGLEHWIALAAERGVGEHIRWHRGVSQAELFALLPEYDSFLFPTQPREPFGFAPIEAAACGLVPIITRNAGVAERLVDSLHCLKIDRASDSLAAAMRQLLSGELDIANMGRRAARLVRQDLSFSRCLDGIERVLRSAARPPDPHRLDEPRLPTVLFAKHALGLHLTTHP